MEMENDEDPCLGTESECRGLDPGQHLAAKDIARYAVCPQECARAIKNNGYQHLLSRQ
jgi:hypothetical protein